MTEQVQESKAGKGLGIAGLVLGILGLVLFWTPFVGFVIAFIGLILAILGFMQANKAGAAKGMIIAGLVLSLVGTGLGGWSSYGWYKMGQAVNKGLENVDFNKELQKAADEMNKQQEEQKPTQ